MFGPDDSWQQVAYGISSSYRQIEVAGWIRQWLEMVD
jgi:hypothetical protein